MNLTIFYSNIHKSTFKSLVPITERETSNRSCGTQVFHYQVSITGFSFWTPLVQPPCVWGPARGSASCLDRRDEGAYLGVDAWASRLAEGEAVAFLKDKEVHCKSCAIILILTILMKTVPG